MKVSYPRRRLTESTEAERFWPRVEKTQTGKRCWRWIGGHSGNERGYMSILADGRSKRVAAHRVSWEIHNGPIAGDLDVLHHCDVLDCVRPDHLYLGTDDNNARDRTERGQSHRKMTWDKVCRARALYNGGSVTQRELARMFGISQQCMQRILTETVYKPDRLPA